MQLQAKARLVHSMCLWWLSQVSCSQSPERAEVFVSSLRRQYGVEVVFVKPAQEGDAA
jgi:hypothetical protein